MACRLPFGEEDLYCPICCDVFREPLLLACSHSVCRKCLQTFWNRRGARECPICRTVSDPEPAVHLMLQNFCQLMRNIEAEDQQEIQNCCPQHHEPIDFFCLEHQELVCGACRSVKMHLNHQIIPAEDASKQLKQELQVKLQLYLEKQRICEQLRQSWDETEEHMKKQSLRTEHHIRNTFEELHQFLQSEEEARVTKLRREMEQKSEMIRTKTEQISADISKLTQAIQVIEEELMSKHTTFLQMYKATAERTRCSLQDHTTPSGMLIDVTKHVANLNFHIFEKLQALVRYTPVTLDPNTAHPYLSISEDLTSISYSDEHFQRLPANPERFDGYTSCIGSEGFTAGRHCWDVEVGDNSAWAVGVITESAYRRRDARPKTGLWYVGFCNGKYGKGSSPEVLSLLRVGRRVRTVRVCLDCEGGKVMFSDSARNLSLHVFKLTFKERVFPYFYNHCTSHSLRIRSVDTVQSESRG